jgi:hypothetical protein
MDLRCPRKLNALPCQSCPEGRKAIDLARQGKQGGCPWFVADAESHYCFFKYMADNGQAVPAHRIARLLMIDDNEVKRVIQSFRRRMMPEEVDSPEEILDL